jgi:hypothetical protein
LFLSMSDALPPQTVVMQMVMGAWAAQTISAVTRLGVPDFLERHGPSTAARLRELGVDARPELLERALRTCASLGIFTEDPAGRFGPTSLSAVLTESGQGSVKQFVELIGGRWWQPIGSLAETLRNGQPPASAASAISPGPADPEHRRRFGRAMKSRADSVRNVLEHVDFSAARIVVDGGGGFGHLAIAIATRYPGIRAVVLDLPDVAAMAKEEAAGAEAGVLARVEFLGGDMFADVPPGDTYVVKTIIHDWDDASAVRVLRNCAARVPAHGRVLCVDNVLPPMGDTGTSGTKLLDMLMMVTLPGRERTEPEWRALYDAAGLRVTSIRLVNPRSGESIIEGVKPAW